MFEIEIGNFPIFLAGANKNTSDLYTKMNKMMRKKWTEFLPWKMFADWEDYSIFGGLLRQARAERETESVFECVCCLPVWAKLPANVAGEPQKSWFFWEIWGKPTGQAGQRERQREKVCLCAVKNGGKSLGSTDNWNLEWNSWSFAKFDQILKPIFTI